MINPHILTLKPSATLKINQYVQRLKSEGEDIIHFGFGQSPFPVPERLVSEVKGNAHCSSYLPSLGLRELREEIAHFLEKHQQMKVHPEQVLIGPGSKELLFQTILLLEGSFLIPKGSWVSYGPQIQAVNKDFVVLETEFSNNFKLNPEVLEDYCTAHADESKILILNTPNNPSGAVYSGEELQELAKVCKKHDLYVISDEIYSQILFSDNQTSAPSMSVFYPEKTFVFGGLSKVFAAGGYRLGFMILPLTQLKLQAAFHSLFSETFSAVASPIQHAAIVAYSYEESIQKHVTGSVAVLNHLAQYVYDELTAAEIDCTVPQGGFYVTVGFNNFKEKLEDKKLETSQALATYLLQEYKVALLPGIDFYFGPDELFFRLAYVDFDGEKALNAYSTKKEPLDNSFIEMYAPNIVKGIQRLKGFTKNLKEQKLVHDQL